jgi:hypothetical protein
MADVKPVARKDAILKDNVLDEEEIRQGIELLF